MEFMIRRFLRWLLTCPHDEMIRERRDDGGLDVVCSRCGHRQVLIARTR